MEIVLLLGALLCVFLWKRYRQGRETAPQIRETGEEALLEETIGVLSDFLERGKSVAILGGSYQGTISVRLHQRERGEYGYTICMYDSSDLRACPEEAVREQGLTDFLQTYADCYDPVRDALVYTTTRTAHLSVEAAGQMEGERYRRTKALSLALVVTNTVLQTKGL